jgi:hypothetical protein
LVLGQVADASGVEEWFQCGRCVWNAMAVKVKWSWSFRGFGDSENLVFL